MEGKTKEATVMVVSGQVNFFGTMNEKAEYGYNEETM